MPRLFKRKSATVEFSGPVTVDNLRDWLTRRLAQQIKVAPSEIDPSRSFEAYGLDSLVAVQVSGELEKIVEHRLSPGLLYEYQTIDELAGHLIAELGNTTNSV